MFPSLSADASGPSIETETFGAAHHEMHHNKPSQGWSDALLSTVHIPPLHRTAACQEWDSHSLCLSDCWISLSLSLSLCLWCNAVFSALAASLAGALQVLEIMRGLLCKSSLHAAAIPIFMGSMFTPVIKQEHEEDIFCPSSTNKVKAEKGPVKMFDVGVQFLGCFFVQSTSKRQTENHRRIE